MKICGLTRRTSLIVCCGFLFVYACIQIQHFYDTAVSVPITQRVEVKNSELRLPRLYFCPAERGNIENFEWYAFECKLSYKKDRTTCPARLESYRGREPDKFKGDNGGSDGGKCVEFGTHMIGVREEGSAAWNEISLRAAFKPANADGLDNALQEIELGFQPTEWRIGRKKSSLDSFYWPLLRVPMFFAAKDARGVGVATRTYLAKEVDRGLTHAGRYWYTYGAMQIAVENTTIPDQPFVGHELPAGHIGVVHVIITLEDFSEYDFQVASAFFPFLSVVGEIAGVAAVLAWLFLGHGKDHVQKRGCDNDFESGMDGACYNDGDHRSAYGDHSGYDAVAGRPEEEQALLSVESATESQGPL